MADNRRYEIEVWWRGQTFVGEIGRLCRNINYSMTRNGVYTLDFSIDSTAYREWCESINEDPMNVLMVKNADIKLKRNGEYVLGAFVADYPDPQFNQDNSVINIACDGYLNLLADQLIDPVRYNQWDGTAIAWDLINKKNQRPNSTLGITLGTVFNTGKKRDREYADYQEVKESIINLTSLGDGQNDWDFEIDAMRRFNTYDKLGSYRPEIALEYPAPRKGIGVLSMGYLISGEMANRVILKGSGQGVDTLLSIREDNDSQIKYGVHEATLMFSDISIQNTLDEHAESELRARKDPAILPQPVVSGAQFDLDTIKLGDVITMNNQGDPLFAIRGEYRIEQIDVRLDENMAETIKLTLSTHGDS